MYEMRIAGVSIFDIVPRYIVLSLSIARNAGDGLDSYLNSQQ